MKKHQLPLLLAIATALAYILTPINARADTVYVSNAGNNTIKKFDLANGDYLGTFGNNSDPYGLAFDGAGNLFVATGGYGIPIEKYTPGGVGSVFASGLSLVSGIAFDSAGNLYEGNYGDGTIGKFTSGGIGSVFSPVNYHVSGLVFDGAGNLYAASFDSAQIEKFTPAGIRSVFANLAVSGGAGLAFDREGNLYAASQANNTIEKFTPGGVGSVFASTGLSSPYGLAFDSAGNLYVANYGNNTIEKFSPTGTDLGVFASGLSSPTWIAILSPMLTSVVVTPANPVVGVGTNQQFTATGTFSDLSSRPLTSGGNTWTNGAAIPAASYGLGGAVVGGKFYAISGFATARLGIYDPANNTWTDGAPLPADTGYNLRQYSGITVLDGKIYVVGGDTGGSGDRSTLLRYDPALNAWATLAPMPLGARYSLGAAALNGKLYAVGGVSIASSSYLNRVEEYDPTSNTWTTKASMPTARAGALVGAIGGKLYVAGGSDASGALTSTHVYNPALNTWSTNAPMPFAGNGEGVVLNGKLYSIGAGPSPERGIFAYDPASNSWSTNFALMPTGRHALGVAADDVNNKIFAVGGWNGSFASALEIFTPPGEVIWSSGSPTVASINANGLATGLSVGSSTITATAGNLTANTVLTVVTQPAITSQPMNVTVSANGTATFTAGSSGGALAYQWQFNGTNIAGATGSTLALVNVNLGQIGCYSVIVSNVAGTTTSSCAQLTVLGINMYAGLTIHGSVGANYRFEYVNDLNNTNWLTLTNIALPTNPYLLVDTDSPNHARRFYRAILVP
ncbi:MAG: hypothetical protein HOP33_13890 [Verrucomicrobia bacterium]|nr:hypothetical protein [Verrucomicrobiota bacterium]